MKRRHKIGVIGNLVLFQALWFTTVLGAAAGEVRPALAVLVLLLAWGPLTGSLTGSSAGRDLRLVCFGVALGAVVELLWVLPGLIEYRLQPVSWLPPPWILLLWAGLAVSFHYSLSWLQGRPGLAAVFGAVGGVCSMAAGIRFGAASAPLGMVPLLVVYGLVFSLLVPLLAWRARAIWSDNAETMAG